MLNNDIFYHGITRKIIVGFGSLFSDIRLKRENADKTVSQTLAVPIAYAPKEKWLVRIEQDTNLDNHTYVSLPRLSFEITGMDYDPTRKVARTNYLTCSDGTSMSRTYAPVPYNIEISLYVLTKTQEDALQIVEQILPFFTPELTMSLRAVPEAGVVMDIPVILNNVSINDEYDGDFETRRFITYTLNFTLKANMFGPVSQGGAINRVTVNTTYSSLDSIGQSSTGNISSSWNENLNS